MSVKKNLFALLAIVLCVGVFAAEKIKLAPGAGCFAWNQNTKSKPESLPVGGFVDESTKFYSGNIRQCEELKNIRGRHFIMWEGYLQVPKTGKYRFSYTTDGMYGRYANVTIFLNEKLLLKRFEGEDETVSAVATLNAGFVKVRIYCNPSANDQGFSLKFAPAKAMKMTNITPMSLYHRIDEEE